MSFGPGHRTSVDQSPNNFFSSTPMNVWIYLFKKLTLTGPVWYPTGSGGDSSYSTYLFLNEKCVDKLCTTNIRHKVAYHRIKAAWYALHWGLFWIYWWMGSIWGQYFHKSAPLAVLTQKLLHQKMKTTFWRGLLQLILFTGFFHCFVFQ